MSEYATSPEEFEELRKQQMLAAQLREPTPSAQGGGTPPIGMAQQFMGGGSGGGAQGLGAAGPWAALAAAVVANETYQNKQGNRPEDFGDHMKALASGEVLEMDAKKYIGGPVGDFVGTLSSPKGIGTHIKKSLKPWEWFN